MTFSCTACRTFITPRTKSLSLPKLIDKATNRDLSKGLRDHLEETKKQIERLDQAFKKLGKQPQGVKCPAIDGLIEEGDEMKLPTRMFWMPPLSALPRRSSIMRWRVTER